LGRLLERFWKLRHEISWIIVGQALGFVGGFIGIKVLTNVMGPKGYGQLALGLSIAGLFAMFLYGPIANAVLRFFVVYREQGKLGVYFSLLKKCHLLLIFAVSFLAFGACGIAWYYLGTEWALIILFSSLYGIASGINASYLSLQSAVRQRKIAALHQGADVLLRVGLSIVLLLAFKNSGYISLMGYLLGTLIVTVSQWFFALKNPDVRENWLVPVDASEERKARAELSGYAGSFVIFSGFAAISMYADRWILQGFFGEGYVGIYAAIFQIAAAPVNILFAMVNQLMVPIVFERAGSMTTTAQAVDSAVMVRATIIVSGVLAVFLVLAAYLLGEPLVRLLTSAAFAGYHAILWLTVLGLSLFNIGQLFCLKGLYCNQPRIYIWPKGVQAASLLAFGFPLVRNWGLLGMSTALCASSLLYIIIVLVVNRRIKTGAEASEAGQA